MKYQKKEKIISKHILEVRHQAYMRFLDIRGEIAHVITNLDRFNFEYWAPADNRVDLMDMSKNIKVFVTLTNFGLVIENAPSLDYFKNQSILFLEKLLESLDFSDRKIVRLGARSFFLIDRKQKFNDIKTKYQNRFLSLNPKGKELFDAELIDIGAPFNFRETDRKNSFNTMSGPMEIKQMRQFFGSKKLYPDNLFPKSALYFEIDYFTKDIGRKDKDTLLQLAKTNINRSLDIFMKFKDYVLE